MKNILFVEVNPKSKVLSLIKTRKIIKINEEKAYLFLIIRYFRGKFRECRVIIIVIEKRTVYLGKYKRAVDYRLQYSMKISVLPLEKRVLC